MKMKTLSLLAGVSVPLIATASASAGFLGIKTVSKEQVLVPGLLVVNVYAEFDRPGEDQMQAVAGTMFAPMIISVTGGTFYNHAFGAIDNSAPSTVFIGVDPKFAYDTFATIGAKVSSAAFPDATTLTPGLPLIAGSVFSTTVGGWAVTPIDPQTDPFNTDYSSGNGQILIGQFSTADGTAIQGTMLIMYISNGVVVSGVVSFFHVPGPGALWLLGATGLLCPRRRR